MENQTISALMAPRTWTIGLDDTVQATETFLSKKGLSWAPVVGANGVVSSLDFVKTFV